MNEIFILIYNVIECMDAMFSVRLYNLWLVWSVGQWNWYSADSLHEVVGGGEGRGRIRAL